MYVCFQVYVFANMHAYMHAYMHAHAYIYIYTHVRVCLSQSLSVTQSIYSYQSVSIYLYIYTVYNLYTYIYIYISCLFIYMHMIRTMKHIKQMDTIDVTKDEAKTKPTCYFLKRGYRNKLRWMVAKSCTTLDGWNFRNPNKIMECLPPIIWCRVPFQPGIRGQLRQLLFQALSTRLQHLDPLLLSSLVKRFIGATTVDINGIRMGYEWWFNGILINNDGYIVIYIYIHLRDN